MSNWRGKKRWSANNKFEPIPALMAVESIVDSAHQRKASLTERDMSRVLGICRSAIETARHQGFQQKTIPGLIKGTKRPKAVRIQE